VVIMLVLLAGELAPRAVAGRSPVRVALAAAPLLLRGSRILGRLFYPLLALVRLISGRPDPGDASADELQVREALEIGAGEGVVEAEEQRLIERAFKLDELNAWDAMTPRVDIVAWQDTRLLGEALGELEGVPHSRVPVYGETIDDVTGILHVRDAYRAFVAGRQDTPLGELAREAMFVPGSLSLAKLLAEFRARRMHMGIVADEFGGTDGLITLEDVLEELVGEIVDETDVDEDPVMQLSPDEIVASGAAEVREINDRYDFELQAGEHRSLNGFILEELGHVPAAGHAFKADGVHVEILEATDTQVLKARLRRTAAPGTR
jgi:CBS domain containing-hemolysin-like protein